MNQRKIAERKVIPRITPSEEVVLEWALPAMYEYFINVPEEGWEDNGMDIPEDYKDCLPIVANGVLTLSKYRLVNEDLLDRLEQLGDISDWEIRNNAWGQRMDSMRLKKAIYSLHDKIKKVLGI